jgi:hypothetical protein
MTYIDHSCGLPRCINERERKRERERERERETRERPGERDGETERKIPAVSLILFRL